MSGKAYGMKEMKAIVDYLVQRKAYGKVRGKKLWVDFENTKLTDRTWQSLKETFLKRILPDIHNPYYNLSIVQISSFRQGSDFTLKLGTSPEKRTVSGGLSTNVEDPENINQPSTSNNVEVENKSGEETINSKTVSHHRSSAETIVLDPCYDTAEDIQRDLETPNQNEEPEKDNDKSPTKSLRDFITYSEPLTPMLQDVIEDFTSDEECVGSDAETQMKIAEVVEADKKLQTSNGRTSDAPVEISSKNDDVSNNVDDKNESRDKNQHNDNKITTENKEKSDEIAQSTDNRVDESEQEIIELNDDSCHNEINSKENMPEQPDKQIPGNNKDQILDENVSSNNEGKNMSKKNQKTTEIIDISKEKVENSQNTSTQHFSNTTTDTLIPNNQEALNTEAEQNTSKKCQSTKLNKIKEKNTRKRANSQDPITSNQKKLHLIERSKPVSVSDTDTGIKRNGKVKSDTKEVLSSLKQKEKISHNADSENKEGNRLKNNRRDLESLPEENTNKALTDNIDEGEQTFIHDSNNELISSCIENPCLKSVSLYDEQFSSMKFSESSEEEGKISTNRNTREGRKYNKKRNSKANEVVLSKSPSESDNHEVKKRKNDTPIRSVVSKPEREKALANVFGFSSGAVARKRKRCVSYQNRSVRRRSCTRTSSVSSEWTSETESEFVSPPRGRRNRKTKKYTKPKSARIVSLEEDGGLFVMYRKKIYPVIKDGKILKKYVTYAYQNSEDEEGSYWKMKYMEEKKRTAKLQKLINRTSDDDQVLNESGTDLTKPSPSKKPKLLKDEGVVRETITEKEIVTKVAAEIHQSPVAQDKTLKIKITKQNEEVQLEGHWSQIHPVLDHVVQIFHKDTKPKVEANSSEPVEQSKACSSGLSTPVVAVPDPVHEKVKKMETEIFDKIEALDKQEEEISTVPQAPPAQPSGSIKSQNVHGRSRRSVQPVASASQISEQEKKRVSNERQKSEIEENVEKLTPVQVENGKNAIVTRRTRTPRKVLHESTEKNESNVIYTRTKKVKEVATEEAVDDETDVRYKFPSPTPSTRKAGRKSGTNKTSKALKHKNRYAKKTVGLFSSPDNISMNSAESSHGYQDSDISPLMCLRKKKKFSVTSQYNRGKYQNRQSLLRRKQTVIDEMSDQSSNSFPDFCLRSTSLKNSSLNTEVYRTESYQLLMPKSSIFKPLTKIDEIAPTDTNYSVPKKDLLAARDVSDVEYSSNVSLPPSPVLSIVENISIRKSIDDVIGEEVENKDRNEEQKNYCNFKITNLEIPTPLQQDCDVQATEKNSTAIITDSLLNKMCTVNIEDNPTLSNTITQKLRALLLESAKKFTRNSQVADNGESHKMDVDTNLTKTTNQTRSKKRCSTPLKRKTTRKSKSKKPEIDINIEEEHTESYSRGGRHSCPPLSSNTNTVEYVIHSENPNKNTQLTNPKRRRKSDNIIKVKILRPRPKRSSKETKPEKASENIRDKSIHADIGINDAASCVFFQEINDNVELIHNHSETCLQANECVGDSVEFIKNSSNSIISIDTNSVEHWTERERDIKFNIQSGQNMLTNDTCDAKFLHYVMETSLKGMENNGGTTHTPMNSEGSPNSLITEDLSDCEPVQGVIPRTGWYLLSEDETTNTNFAIQNHSNSDACYGSNLNLLFPITCAVPNLSTITEMSKDIEYKPMDMDSDT